MKTKIVFLLSAIVCLASCNKQDLITPEHDENEGKEGDYRIEIVDLQSPTKSSPSTVQLSLANLTKASSKRVSAQLKKKSGSNWVDVTTGVVYSWSASSSDSKKFDGSGTVNQSCDISAKATGSGTITVSANLNSTVVATQDVPVTVSDDRALSWSNATTSITSGEVKTATLNSNFSCTATISSNNGSFLVGTSSTNLSSTASVTFSTNQTKTIYYKYTGSEQTTVKIDAVYNGIGATCTINTSAPVSEGIDYTISISRSAACGYTITVYPDDSMSNFLCTAGCTNSNYSTTYKAEGKTTAKMTPDKSYYITVTRVFGSTTATVLNYSGTKIFDTSGSSSGSITYGPIDGSRLLFESGGAYKLSLTLTAK